MKELNERRVSILDVGDLQKDTFEELRQVSVPSFDFGDPV